MPYTDTEQRDLLTIARHSIQHGLTTGSPITPEVTAYSTALQALRASFVTLEIAAELRGCIGGTAARHPLVVDVAQHAFAAAFNDPRFPPLTTAEFDQITVHISILTEPDAMQFDSETELLRQLRPHEDGLIIEVGGQRALFLPSVWEILPQPTQFLQRLKLKAGLSEQYWSNELRAARFATINIEESTQ